VEKDLKPVPGQDQDSQAVSPVKYGPRPVYAKGFLFSDQNAKINAAALAPVPHSFAVESHVEVRPSISY
jgi:hypothetical protein